MSDVQQIAEVMPHADRDGIDRRGGLAPQGGSPPERAVIAFCHCGSAVLDVRGWQLPSVAIIACSACGATGVIAGGFTLGRCELPAATIAEARADRAVMRPEGGDGRRPRAGGKA